MNRPTKPGHYWVLYTDGTVNPITFEDDGLGGIETGHLFFDRNSEDGSYLSPSGLESWYLFKRWVCEAIPPEVSDVDA